MSEQYRVRLNKSSEKSLEKYAIVRPDDSEAFYVGDHYFANVYAQLQTDETAPLHARIAKLEAALTAIGAITLKETRTTLKDSRATLGDITAYGEIARLVNEALKKANDHE